MVVGRRRKPAYTGCPRRIRSKFWEVIVWVILTKNLLCTYMCPMPNGFQDRAISPYSSKIVDGKEVLVLFLIN
jgi:hypothetical protein